MDYERDYDTFWKSGEAACVGFSVYTNQYTKGNNGLMVVTGVADHICYKCSSNEEYEYIRRLFEEQGSQLYQSEISGRRIALIELPQGYMTPWGPLNYLELADQKSDGSQKSGWDHIEIRIWYYDRIVKGLIDAGVKVVEKPRPHHTTHEIILPNKFRFVFTNELLVDKIRYKEMDPLRSK